MSVSLNQSSKKQASNNTALRTRTTVLHLCPDLEPANPAREAVELAVLTQRAGWRALVASSGGLLVPEGERAAVRHTRMPLGSIGILSRWRDRIQLNALIQREKPVLIHAHGLESTLHAVGVAHTHHLPLVADLTLPPPDKPKIRKLFEQLDKLPCAVRVPSEYLAKYLSETFKWPTVRMRVIQPGIDTHWCHAGAVSPERLQELTKLWRLPEQAATIVVPMPFVPGGGHKEFLEALAQLKRDDIFAVMVGDNRPVPAYRAQIEETLNALNLGGKVIMPDYSLDWSSACWLSSAVVLPNTSPCWQSYELLVAQAIGRPVIITDCGANKELVQNPGTALVVAPGDVTALAQAIKAAVDLRIDERLSLAKRTHDFVADAFPQAAWFNAMMELYDSLLIPEARRTQSKAEAA